MIASIMPYVCLYSVYLFVSWFLLNKLFEKRMQPQLRGLGFYLFVFLLPVIISVILSLALDASPLRSEVDPNWISFSKTLAPAFLFVHALFWLYGVKCLKAKNEIIIPKLPMRRASDFAMYFTLESTILVLTILPWALLN